MEKSGKPTRIFASSERLNRALGILKATYLIALLHISNENTAYLFDISRYIKCFEARIKHLLCGIKGGTFG